jgi:hypothetical protein
MRAYCEETELARYVWDHFSSFMTEFERRVGQQIVLQEKAAAAKEPEMIRRLVWASEPELAAALPAGADAYR